MNDIILSYLSNLEENNNRGWYHKHKAENKAAQIEFEEIIQMLIFEIGKFDNSILHNNPKDLTFKLTRDTRFSHDKSPYNPTFRCHISSAGKLPVPTGYFLSIQPRNRSFLGGGLFADMFKDATQKIRDYIFKNADEFLHIVNNPDFCNTFQVMGSTLKNVPSDKKKYFRCLYFIEKSSGKISGFSPAMDLPGLMDATTNHRIELDI